MQYHTNYPYATTSQQYGAISQIREEQRRRQQEYSQALAQQVAEREQQKRRQREMDQQYGRPSISIQHHPQQQQGFRTSVQGAFAPPERGMMDGLGRNDHQRSRTNFARGQPQPQMQPHQNLPNVMPPSDYPPAFPQAHIPPGGPGLQPPPPNFSAANNHMQAPDDGQNYPSGFGGPNLQQPIAWQQQQSAVLADFSSGAVGAPAFVPAMAQTRASQVWQGQNYVEQVSKPAAFAGYGSPQREEAKQNIRAGYPQPDQSRYTNVQNGGRRQRTDIHDGGRGDSEEAERFRRKLQQQQEMQLALERQIEEKRQQKLEAKRLQEEEDRREMERYEEEQRQQRAEQERLADEKRRKAEIEQQKADQAAAAVAAANYQAKVQQQQKLHSQINQVPLHRPQFAQPSQQQQQFQQLLQPEMFGAAPSPNRLKNPFTNSRAHLFEDPPQQSPQRGPVNHPNYYGHPHQNASPVRGSPQHFPSGSKHGNDDIGHLVDPSELRHQYNNMREELQRQKQLVDQLQQAQARMQHQQQTSPMRTESRTIPTLMDLEKLRNELRGELAYREQLHRQELASFQRKHHQEESPKRSPRRYPGVKNSLNLSIRASPDRELVQIPREVSPHHKQQLQTESAIDSSMISLLGESKFVYFDGQAGKLDNELARSDDINLKPGTVDERSESIKVEARPVQKSPQAKLPRSPITRHNNFRSVSKSIVSFPSRLRLETLKDTDSDKEDDDEMHEFVMRRASLLRKSSHQLSTSSPTRSRRAAASSHRYLQLPNVLPAKEAGKWHLESLGTDDANFSDSDDDLDVSLDGEQLEALFQRNVRRHEILLGFQAKAQTQTLDTNQQECPQAKLAWSELHHQLENNRVAIFRKKESSINDSEVDNQNDADTDPIDETALVSSSQWMASSLSLPADRHHNSKYK